MIIVINAEMNSIDRFRNRQEMVRSFKAFEIDPEELELVIITPEDLVEIEVIDKSNNRAYIFETYIQAEKSLTRRYGADNADIILIDEHRNFETNYI